MVKPWCPVAIFLPLAAAHSNLIKPKPRNAIDSELPEWKGGNAPYRWQPNNNTPCVCRNGTDVCDSAQTCLWMSVGCTIGCKTCDGGDKGGANPNEKDRCDSGMKATINDPKHRTINRAAIAGSKDDWTKFNPWRAPGYAPVFDACGRAGGSAHPTPGHGEFTNTKYAKFGDLGSQVLPKYNTGTVWEAGTVVETMTSFRANHGGGYQYRLCPLGSDLTEACFQKTPMAFASNSKLMVANGTIIELNSVFVSDGTLPVGGTWQMLGIPDTTHVRPAGFPTENWGFDPPCYEPGFPDHPPAGLHQGQCSGMWEHNITMYDYLRVPEHLKPGEYVLGFRWDCETSAQIWQACADVTITSPSSPPTPAPSPPPAPGKTHYEKPPCQSDEVEAEVQGAGGELCAPSCDNSVCPTDVPAGTRAKPKCILQDASSGKKYCALSCLLPGSCPSGAKCARIGGVTGVCVYPQGTHAHTEKVLEVHRDADLFGI